MDILGSIMNSMDKPPSLTEKEKLAKKSKFRKKTLINGTKIVSVLERKEELEKRQKQEKENYKRFKEKVEGKLKTFFFDEKNTNLKFSPMDQIYRSLV